MNAREPKDPTALLDLASVEALLGASEKGDCVETV
jgi:hypothetical protein